MKKEAAEILKIAKDLMAGQDVKDLMVLKKLLGPDYFALYGGSEHPWYSFGYFGDLDKREKIKNDIIGKLNRGNYDYRSISVRMNPGGGQTAGVIIEAMED
jgi:hypothetical protein